MATREDILERLRSVRDPDLGRDIVSLGFVKDVEVRGGKARLTIELTTPACPVRDQMREEARRAVLALPDIDHVEVTLTSQVRATSADSKAQRLPHIRNIVPIGSGKGGVGKSTVSANLAVALSKLGARVGLMDADVYGPTIPTLMGAGAPPVQRDGKIAPPLRYGVKIMSIAFFAPPGQAAIFRGPILSKVVEQFLGDVDWGELDYLLVDLPPGTGDVQLTLCQSIPLTGAAIVSTPQDVALRVAEKAILMFHKLRTPVLGLIENMSGFECSHCGSREEIFGSGGARRYGMAAGIPVLGEIPISTDIRTTSDDGCPIVEAMPESPGARAFWRIAENLAAQVSIQNMGDGADGRPVPVEISQPSRNEVRIRWKDGHESLYTGYELRLECSCAQCVDEMSGRRRLAPDAIDKDVCPLSIAPVGRYAVRLHFSDGHTTGIYTFEHLRELCTCRGCTDGAKQMREREASAYHA